MTTSSSILRGILTTCVAIVLIIVATAPATENPHAASSEDDIIDGVAKSGSDGGTWWWNKFEKTSIIAKGASFETLETSEIETGTEQQLQLVDNSLLDAFTNFNLEVTKCFARLTKLSFMLIDKNSSSSKNRNNCIISDRVREYVH